MKALKMGFLKGCPDLREELVIKYLNLSPATAKGHMKHPKKGIWSTKMKPLQVLSPSPQQPALATIPRLPITQVNPPIRPLFNEAPPYHSPAYNEKIGPNIIANDESIASVFCFDAFAEKITGVIYNDLTGMLSSDKQSNVVQR